MNGLSRRFFRQIVILIAFTVALVFCFLRFTSIVGAFWFLVSILTPFIIGFFLAFIVNLPMTALERLIFGKVKKPRLKALARPVSMILALILVCAIFVGAIAIVLPQAVLSLKTFVEKLPEFSAELSAFLRNFKFLEQTADKLDVFLKSVTVENISKFVFDFVFAGNGAIQNAVSAASSIMGGLLNSVLAIMFMLYILASKERLLYQSRRIIYSCAKEAHADRIVYVFHLLNVHFHYFLKGTILGSIIMGLLTTIGMYIFGLPYPAMVGVVIGITTLIPLVGPYIGVTLGVLFVLLISPFQALIFLIFILVLQQLHGSLIYPKIVGKALGIPAMWTMIAILLGGALIGIVGMWLFVPLFSVIYTLLSEYTLLRLQEKNIDVTHKQGEEVSLSVRQSMGMSKEEAEQKSAANKPGMIKKYIAKLKKYVKKQK